MIIDEERDELLAAARRVPNTTQVQLPDQKADAPVYVRSSDAQTTPAVTNTAVNTSAAPADTQSQQVLPGLKPIDSGVKTLQINETSDTSAAPKLTKLSDPATVKPTEDSPVAQLSLPAMVEMKRGQTMKIPVLVNSATSFRSAVIGLKFDESKVAVRSVRFGDVFGSELVGEKTPPFLNEKGKMYVSLSTEKREAPISSGTLAYVEIEALADGIPQISLEQDILTVLSAQGKNFQIKF